MKKYIKEIILSLIYIIVSLVLYTQLDLEEYSSIFDTINMLGLGVLIGSILILLIEDLGERLQKSGRLKDLDDISKSKYAHIAFFFGFSSLLLDITKNFI